MNTCRERMEGYVCSHVPTPEVQNAFLCYTKIQNEIFSDSVLYNKLVYDIKHWSHRDLQLVWKIAHYG